MFKITIFFYGPVSYRLWTDCLGSYIKTKYIESSKIPKSSSENLCHIYYFNISSSSLIKSLGWLTVTKRRDYLTLVLMYKCISSTAPDYLCDLFTYTNDIHDRNTRTADNMNLYVPKALKLLAVISNLLVFLVPNCGILFLVT